MTITIIPINDPKAPDIKQTNSLGGLFKRILTRALLFSIGLSILIGIFNKFEGFFIGIFVLFFLAIAAQIMIASFKVRMTQNRQVFVKVHDYYKAHAVKNGLTVSFENPGIFVDTNAKKVVFTIDPFGLHQYLICDYSDILSWQTHRDEMVQNDPIRINLQTGQVQGGPKHLMTAHGMTVNINYPESPRQGFWTGNDADSGLWSARFDSLVNGQ